MSLVEALLNFEAALKRETGINKPIVKVGLHPEVFMRMSEELYDQMKYSMLFHDGEVSIYGIQLLPRVKDTF